MTGTPADRRLLDDRTVVDEQPVVARTSPADGGATAAAGAVPVAGQGQPAPTPAPTTVQQTETRQSRRELPEPPRRPGIGRHLLGILVGLVLTPVALLLAGIGIARLADAAGSGSVDALGISLLVLGAVLLGLVVLLGLWSPAVPITGGVVWGIALGVAYLVIPGVLEDSVDSMAGDRVVPAAVEQLTESATSGLLLVTGVLLLAAGLATARARRAGRRWAEGVAAAEVARDESRVTTQTSA